jgi:hypothetical protein
MARKRTGSAIDEVDPTDMTLPESEVMNAPEEPAAPEPVKAGFLRLEIRAKRRSEGGDPIPPGIYELPKKEGMHFVNTGVAKILAVG